MAPLTLADAMQDYPPHVTAYLDSTAERPWVATPLAFLRWTLREQGGVFFTALAASLVWMVPQSFSPWLLGKAIDEGIVGGDQDRLRTWLLWLTVVTVVGAASGIFYHTYVVRQWLVALYGTVQLITHKVVELGHVLLRRVPTGEVLSVAGGDANEFGALMEITTRTLSMIFAYLVVAGIVLTTSVKLGLLVLVLAPVVLLVAYPLVRPLGAAQTHERSRNSDLTSLATDIVAGLRILRGIGGEERFGANYAEMSQRAKRAGVRAGTWQAAVDAIGVLLAGLSLVALIWVGVSEVAGGALTIGELIAFLGYGLFLLQPMRTFFEFGQKLTKAVVSARKTTTVLTQESPWQSRPTTLTWPSGEALRDEVSGLVVRPGQLTMVVCGLPEQSAALADRLGRYLPAASAPESGDDDSDDTSVASRRRREEADALRAGRVAADAAMARDTWGVRIGDVDLADLPLAEVRRHILVSDTGAILFAGTLQSAIDPHDVLTREQAELALHVASAEDVYDAMPGGWQGRLDEKGRGLSGGQRQRLVLARAVAADPEVLVLVEPTSAVDAHTEARIAERLAAVRRGKTTVVMTASPLLLHYADEIALLDEETSTVTAVGTHQDLLIDSPAYRAVVIRGEDA